MHKRLSVFITIGVLLLFACNQAATQKSENQTKEDKLTLSENEEKISETADKNSPVKVEEDQTSEVAVNSTRQEPKNVMEFFALLPKKYFNLEGCFRDDDKDCRKARAEYLKNYGEIEDIKNGYFKAGCDGGQSCIEMALFKRPDKSYVIALATFSEATEDNYFLDYKKGVWTDVSQKIVPEFSKDKRYEIPRYGTIVKVFSTKLIEKGDDYEIREKDKNIYDLEWKDGKFLKK